VPVPEQRACPAVAGKLEPRFSALAQKHALRRERPEALLRSWDAESHFRAYAPLRSAYVREMTPDLSLLRWERFSQ
jgi:hypothetical protein